jgi:hypothetical protein
MTTQTPATFSRPRHNRYGASARVLVSTHVTHYQPLRVTIQPNGQILIGAGFGCYYIAGDEVDDRGRRRLHYYGRYYDENGYYSLDKKRQPERDGWIDDAAYQKLRAMAASR